MNTSLAGTGPAAGIGLVDHHCHGVVSTEPDRDAFELMATESDWPPTSASTIFDSPVGLVFRAVCAPLLGLPKHCDGDDYWARRTELGEEEVRRRLLAATGIDHYVVDTGFKGSAITPPDVLAAVTGATADEIVRLEALAEAIAPTSTAAAFVRDFDAAIAEASQTAVGFKTIVAYRFGLDFDPDRPSEAEVSAAADEWLRHSASDGDYRISHPVLLRHLIWRAVDEGKPIQFHVGYGDSDINLHRCDPTKMTEFIRRTRTSGASIMLLHCYPFVPEAGFLAQVYPHVYLDTGAASHYTGWSSHNLIRQSLELAPFDKVLFSSDAWGLPELYTAGVTVWRRGVSRLFDEWIAADEISSADAERYISWIASDNAQRVYRLTRAR